MYRSVIVELQADRDATLEGDSGRYLHGFWFKHWKSISLKLASDLHETSVPPFTLSPLLGFRNPFHGVKPIKAGMRAWFRITTLDADVSRALVGEWLPQLPEEITLAESHWRVMRNETTGRTYIADRVADPDELADRYLLGDAPNQWRLEFTTPTAFKAKAGYMLFPLPNALVGSWERRWRAYGSVMLPEDLNDRVYESTMISHHRIRSQVMHGPNSARVGFVGTSTLKAHNLDPAYARAIDLLVAFSHFCGTGHHTTQGMGMTRVG